MAWQNAYSTSTQGIGQNTFLNSGTNVLTLYGGPRPTYYNTLNSFSITVGSKTILANTSYTQNANWQLFTVNFNIVTAGYYILTINNNGANSDTTICFSNIVLTTPPNTGVLTVNVTNYYPNFNGFNIYDLNQQNIQSINVYPNETLSLYSECQNNNTNSNLQTQISNAQTQINNIQYKYYPSQVINIRSFGSSSDQSLLTTSTNRIVSIYSCSFTPFSNNSTISITFNVVANITGSTNIVFQSNILLNSNITQTKGLASYHKQILGI